MIKFNSKQFKIDLTNVVEYSVGFLDGIHAGKKIFLNNLGKESVEVIKQFIDSISTANYDLKDAYYYAMTLPVSYYGEGSYTKWIKVGWSSKNTSDKLLIVWLAFSAQSPTFHFSSIPDLCEQWRKFEVRTQNGVTKLSLMHWSKTDAPDDFERVRLNSLDYFVDETLKVGGKPGQRDISGPGDCANVQVNVGALNTRVCGRTC